MTVQIEQTPEGSAAEPWRPSRLARTASWLVANGVVTLTLGAGYWIVAARRADVADLGLAAAEFSQILLAANLGVIGIKNATARAIAADRARARAVTTTAMVVAAVLAVASSLLIEAITHGFGFGASTAWSPAGTAAMCLTAVLWAWFVLQDSVLTAVGRAAVVPLVNGIHGVVKLALLASLSGSATQLILWSWFVPAGVLVPVTALIVWRSTPATVGGGAPPRQDLFDMGAEHLASAIWLVTTLGMPTLVSALAGPEASGAWYLTFSLTHPLYLVTSAIGGATIVEVAAEGGAAAREIWRASVRYAMILVVPAVAIGVIGAPLAISVFGSEYEAAVPSLRLVSLGALAFVVVSSSVNVARGLGRAGSVARWHLLIAVVLIPTAVVLVPEHGATGAGWAWLIGLAVPALLRLVMLARGVDGLDRAPDGPLEDRVGAAEAALGIEIGIDEVWSSREDVLVALGSLDGHPGVVRLASTRRGRSELERHGDAVSSVRDATLAGSLLVPAILEWREADDWTACLEARGAGTPLEHIGSAARLETAVAAAAAVLDQLDPAQDHETIAAPLARWLAEDATEALRDQLSSSQLELVQARLASGLEGRRLAIGRIHGDMSLANVLIVDGEPCSIIDWETSIERAPRGVDQILLRMAAARAREGVEYGALVARTLGSGDSGAAVSLVADGIDLDEGTAALLGWTYHVGANLRKETAYGRGSYWYSRNVRPVLRALHHHNRLRQRFRRSLSRTFGPPATANGASSRGSWEHPVATSDRWIDVARPTGVEGLVWVAAATAAVMWVVAAIDVDPRSMSPYGLGVDVGPLGWTAVALLATSLALGVAHRVRPWATWTPVVLLATALHATPALLYGTPRYPWSWKHLGIVEYITRTGSVDRDLEALSIYHNWPGFFSFTAAISDATGVDPQLIATWAPPLLGLFQLAGVVFVIRVLTADTAVRVVAVWLYVCFNWVGQEYFSPQAFGFALHLVFIGLVLRLFGEELPGRPALHRRARVALSLMAVQVLLVIVASHQLTPLMLMMSLGALLVTRQLRGVWPMVAVGSLVVLWGLSFALPYVAENVAGELESFGAVVSNSDAVLGSSIAEPHASQTLTSLAGRALTAAMVVGLVAGLVVRWRRGHRDVAAIALALAPWGALVVNDFDGEMVFRVMLFSAPFAGLLSAHALLGAGPSRVARRVRPLLLGGVLFVVVALFLSAYYGKERRFYFSPEEIEVVEQLMTEAPPGSLIVEPNRSYPNQFLNYEQFIYVAIDREPAASQWEFVGDPERFLERWLTGFDGPAAYVVITESMIAAADDSGSLPRGELLRVRERLVASDRFEVVLSSDRAVVLVAAAADAPDTQEVPSP